MSLRFNEPEIEDRMEAIFKDGAHVEAAFNIDSTCPIVRPTRIYTCDHPSRKMIIHQTHPKVSRAFKYKTMDIAALMRKELNQNLRVAVRCRIVKFIQTQEQGEGRREKPHRG